MMLAVRGDILSNILIIHIHRSGTWTTRHWLIDRLAFRFDIIIPRLGRQLVPNIAVSALLVKIGWPIRVQPSPEFSSNFFFTFGAMS